jgi:Spy/CpxP family protein refolding chaperone
VDHGWTWRRVGREPPGGLAVSAASRQRVRRALVRLGLTRAQAASLRRLLRDDRRRWEAARQRLAECRRDLAVAIAGPMPDSLAALELTLEERLLAEKERELTVEMEKRTAALLRPDQAVRLRALAPPALGDVLGRICA